MYIFQSKMGYLINWSIKVGNNVKTTFIEFFLNLPITLQHTVKKLNKNIQYF